MVSRQPEREKTQACREQNKALNSEVSLTKKKGHVISVSARTQARAKALENAARLGKRRRTRGPTTIKTSQAMDQGEQSLDTIDDKS